LQPICFLSASYYCPPQLVGGGPPFSIFFFGPCPFFSGVVFFPLNSTSFFAFLREVYLGHPRGQPVFPQSSPLSGTPFPHFASLFYPLSPRIDENLHPSFPQGSSPKCRPREKEGPFSHGVFFLRRTLHIPNPLFLTKLILLRRCHCGLAQAISMIERAYRPSGVLSLEAISPPRQVCFPRLTPLFIFVCSTNGVLTPTFSPTVA